MRCSFLPGSEAVQEKVDDYIFEKFELGGKGAVLEKNRPYLIPLREHLRLPSHIRGKANPKSSTGRVDVFTRVITDYGRRFDEIVEGYEGPLYLEVVPLSFAIRVHRDLSLNQLRLIVGRPTITDDELIARHQYDPILFRGGQPVADVQQDLADGLFLSLDLGGGRKNRRVGHRARTNAGLLDLSKTGFYQVDNYWEPVMSEGRGRLVLDPARFYLLLSAEAVMVPPDLASEMTAYDPTSGELRTHYAGFFDPGFGYDPTGGLNGSRAALEVRAHDVAFMIEQGQKVCKLTFEKMIAPPAKLYGSTIGSNYQGQMETLGKHFRRKRMKSRTAVTSESLFPLPDG